MGPRGLGSAVTALGVVAALALAPSSARAGDLDALAPRARAYPTLLPDLLHREPRAQWGGIGGAAVDDSGRAHAAVLARLVLDAPLSGQSLYGGLALPLFAALPNDAPRGARTALGGVELRVRWVWPLPAPYAVGLSLGAVVPTWLGEPSADAQRAAYTAASLAPHDRVLSRIGNFTARPAIDVRLVRGVFLVQLRQGFDVSLDSNGSPHSAGILALYLGFSLSRQLSLGLEASESYLLDRTVDEATRFAAALGPMLRWHTARVDVTSGLYAAPWPLASGMASVYGLGLGVDVPFAR